MSKSQDNLWERSIRNEEQLLRVINENTELNKELINNLKTLNGTVVSNNYELHENISVIKKDVNSIKNELLKYLKHAVMISFTVLSIIAGLNVGGVL